MYHEIKEESKSDKAIRILTYIAKEFKNNHESTIYWDKDIVLEAINFLIDIEAENEMIEKLKKMKTKWVY